MAILTTVDSPYYDKFQLRPFNPDALWQKSGDYNIFDEMLEDDQISSALRFRELMIIGKGGRVECEDENVKEFAEWALNRINIKARLREILSGDGYGFSVSEKVPRRVASPFPQNIILDLKTRPPHTWEFDQRDDGDIERIRFLDAKGDIPVPTGRVLHYLNNAEFDNPYGNSDLNLGAYQAWFIKKNVLKYWAIFMERYANPKPFAMYPENASDSEKNDLSNSLKNFMAVTSLIMPEGFDLKFLEAGRQTGETFENAIDKTNMMLARALLLPDLSGMGGGETQGGSFALGSMQGRMFQQVLQSKQERLERLITEDYLPDLIRLNFSKVTKCEYHLDPVSDQDALESLTRFLDAVQKGAAKVDLQDENRIREIVGFDPVDEQAREERKAMALQIATPKPEAGEPQSETEDGPQEDQAQEETDDGEPEEDDIRENVHKYAREQDIKRAEKFFETTEQKIKQAIGRPLMDSIEGLLSEIRRRKIIEQGKIPTINQLSIKNQRKIANAMKSGLMGAVSEGEQHARSEFSLRINQIPPVTPIDPAQFISELSTTVTKDLTEDVLKRIRLLLMQGISNGDGVTQIMGAIERELADFDIDVPQQGEQGRITAPKLQAMVRTNVTKAYNEGRMRFFEQNFRTIHAFEFNAVLDGRTTTRCRDLNGKIIRKGDARRFMPPIHFNCRSFLTAISVFEDDLPEFDDLGDRGSATGQPLNETPKGFFK